MPRKHEYLGEPKLRPLPPRGVWELEEPFLYTTLGGIMITVPRGFITDGASTLGAFVEPIGGHYTVAALVHDYLYTVLKQGKHDAALGRRTDSYARKRKKADLIFREICRRQGVAPLVRFGMFVALRLWGANNFLKGLVVK